MESGPAKPAIDKFRQRLEDIMKNFKLFLGYALAIIVLIGAFALVYRGTTRKQEKVTEADFVAALANGEVATYTIDYSRGVLVFQLFEKDGNGNYLDTKGNVFTFPVDEEGNVDYTLPEGVELKLAEAKQIKLADISASRLTYIDQLSVEQAKAGNGVGILHSYKGRTTGYRVNMIVRIISKRECVKIFFCNNIFQIGLCV